MTRASSAVGVGFAAAVAMGLALPGLANADPITDFLCNSGSAQFCPPPPGNPVPPSGGYANCTDAWNAGVAPLHRGDPGYASKLDRDNDGIACEKDPR